MTPIVAIVGRPNVGKSTLFNRLTRSHQALVDDLPGVTRDRLYGNVLAEGRSFRLVDTGGFDPPADQAFAHEVHAQIKLAIEEADLILFLADGNAGLNPQDAEVVNLLRKSGKPVIHAVNKVDGPEKEDAAQEFQALGVDNLQFISAAHGYGIRNLLANLLELLPSEPEEDELPDEDQPAPPVRVALLGRPNVGKSSMLNALVGAPRVVVSAVPGTTRDAIDTPLRLDSKEYVLIDTAGIRRQGRVKRGIEKAGIFRSLRAVERAHVVVAVIDASEGLTDQDLRLVGQAVEAHRGLVVVVNKWDLLLGDTEGQRLIKDQVQRLQGVAPWAPVLYLSAKTGKNLGKLLPAVDQVYEQYGLRLATAALNPALYEIVGRHQPPVVHGRRLKFFYASQVGVRPPTVVIFVSDPQTVHFSYRRYLLNELRKALGLSMCPLRLHLRARSGRRPRRSRT